MLSTNGRFTITSLYGCWPTPWLMDRFPGFTPCFPSSCKAVSAKIFQALMKRTWNVIWKFLPCSGTYAHITSGFILSGPRLIFQIQYFIRNWIYQKKGNQYLSGKRDLLGLIIAFRYLLPKQDFLEFKRALIGIINKYIKNSGQISESSLLDIMGFPANWKDITRYRI